MATTLPLDRQRAAYRPLRHAWFVCCGAGWLAVLAATVSCAAETGDLPAQPTTADAPVEGATLLDQLAQAEAAQDAGALLLDALHRAVDDLNTLAAVPNSTFHAHPALQRLHQQWSEVHERQRALLETLLPAHPRVQLCLAQAEALRPVLQRELQVAIDTERGLQPALRTRVARLTERLAEHLAEHTAPPVAQAEPVMPVADSSKPAQAAADSPTLSPDPQTAQRLVELEARAAALARAEEALAAAQARIAATASQTPSAVEPPRAGGRIPLNLANGITGGLMAGGIFGLIMVLVTARRARFRAQSAREASVPSTVRCELPLPAATAASPATISRAAIQPAHAVEPAPVQPAVPAPTLAAPLPTRPAPSAPATPAVMATAAPAAVTPTPPVVTEPVASPASAPASPNVTVPITPLSPPVRRPSPRPNRPQSPMTLKEALFRCAEATAARP